VDDLTVIAIDWSGAKGEQRTHPGIWLTEIRGGDTVRDSGGWSRPRAVEYVLDATPPVVAGFDFSFGAPAWFARTLGSTTLDEVWSRAAREGERWLAPSIPFWRDRCAVARDQRFRACEERLRREGDAPKSLFQLVGAGQVGFGSVRGMPYLARLRDHGFAVWPLDDSAARTAVEIYPSALRRRFPAFATGPHPTPDARDARLAARVMWEHRAAFAGLRAADDPVTRLEGDVWMP
jgi:hypothetical protein